MRKRTPLWPVFGTMEDLHPLLAGRIHNLMKDPEIGITGLTPFETYRSPSRQRELLTRQPPVTRAKPWDSAHQYGMAVDFVAFNDEEWSWTHLSDVQWDSFHDLLKHYQLAAPIKWDPGHVEPLEGWKSLLAEWLI